jgi:hypothetical protein
MQVLRLFIPALDQLKDMELVWDFGLYLFLLIKGQDKTDIFVST